MVIFDCDIVNTFTGTNDNSLRKKELKEFANNLNGIMQYFKSENMIFSFFSSESIGGVLKSVEEIAPYINSENIQFASQYGNCEKYKEGKIILLPESLHNKVNQIVEQIIDYKKSNIHIEKIIYADDTEMNQLIAQYIIKKMFPEIEVVSLIPGSFIEKDYSFSCKLNGLCGLNECLQKYIYSLNSKKNKALK